MSTPGNLSQTVIPAMAPIGSAEDLAMRDETGEAGACGLGSDID